MTLAVSVMGLSIAGAMLALILVSLRRREPSFAKAVAEQVFDNALIAAGLMDDPRSMLARLNSILEAAARNSDTTSSATTTTTGARYLLGRTHGQAMVRFGSV